jgi:uncharacterized membrane protein (UPF0136 family)
MQKSNWRTPVLLAGLSLGIALFIGALAGLRSQGWDVAAGWAAALAVMLIAHAGQRWLERRPEPPAITARLIPLFIRLLFLLVIIFIVLFTPGPEKGPFLMGLMITYFTGLGWEIAWFAARQ